MFVDIWEGGDPFPEARLFCERWGVEATVLIDEGDAFATRLGVRGVPTNVVVDADGVVRAFGPTSPEELAAELY